MAKNNKQAANQDGNRGLFQPFPSLKRSLRPSEASSLIKLSSAPTTSPNR